MRLERHTAVTALTLILISTRPGSALPETPAGAAGAGAAQTYESLFQQVTVAHGGKDQTRRVQRAPPPSPPRPAGGESTRGGGRRSANPKLEPLRHDPRWQGFLDGVKAREAARQ